MDLTVHSPLLHLLSGLAVSEICPFMAITVLHYHIRDKGSYSNVMNIWSYDNPRCLKPKSIDLKLKHKTQAHHVLPPDNLFFSSSRQKLFTSRCFCSKTPRRAVSLSSNRLISLTRQRDDRSSSRGQPVNLTDWFHQPPSSLLPAVTSWVLSPSVSPLPSRRPHTLILVCSNSVGG